MQFYIAALPSKGILIFIVFQKGAQLDQFANSFIALLKLYSPHEGAVTFNWLGRRAAEMRFEGHNKVLEFG